MPIELERVEAGIYFSSWVGKVTVDEFLDTSPMDNLVRQSGDDQVVIIVDTSRCTQYPLSIETLRLANANMSRFNSLGYVFISPPNVLKALAATLTSVFRMKLIFCSSYEDALTAARGLYATGTSPRDEPPGS